MKNNKHIFAALTLLLFACGTDGEDSEQVMNEPVIPELNETSEYRNNNADLSDKSTSFENGIVMDWKQEGTGEQIETGMVVNIKYEVRLEDNTLIESSAGAGFKTFPFMVGFGMQTPGWDFALSKMKIGDSVEVFLPAAMARGEKGYRERDKVSGEVRELIPPHANLKLTLKAASVKQPDRIVDGNKVWNLIEGKKGAVSFDENTQINFHCMVSSPSNPNYVNTFNGKPPFSLRLEDSGVVPGLKKALISAKPGDRMYVYVPAAQAYNEKGYQDFVKPNEPLYYNIFVMDVSKN